MKQINSDINIIGGIPDFSLIEATLNQFAKGKGLVDLKELLVTNNAFDFRTESTRKRFLFAMQRNILVFANDQHKLLIEAVFGSTGLESLKRRVIFWQLLAGNCLFHAISNDVYAKIYFSGRTTLASSEVYAYLKDRQTSFEQLKAFSDSTLKIIASKYLTILKKLGLVEGLTKKKILNVRLSENEVLFFAYFCLSVDGSTADLFKNAYREFFFLEKTELVQALKNIKFIPFIDLASTGEALNVHLKLSPQEMVDALPR